MERIDEIIYDLQGTCKSLGEACNDLGFDESDLTDAELDELDSYLFQCADCGWWYDIGDLSDDVDLICCYCAEDDDADNY